MYAVKKLNREFRGERDRKHRLAEVDAARNMGAMCHRAVVPRAADPAAPTGSHDHCVQYYDAWTDNKVLFIQMELCEGGSLKDYAQTHTFTESMLWNALTDIALGLKHIRPHPRLTHAAPHPDLPSRGRRLARAAAP